MAASSETPLKMCDGPIQRLQPMRMAQLAKVNSFETIGSAESAEGSSTPSATPKYVLPSLRSVGSFGTAASTPKSLDLSSASSFPALGATSAPKGATWGQLRNRLAGGATTQAALPSTATKNSFSALAEDAGSVASSTPLNFKAMLQERIEQDSLEKSKQEYEIDDPLEMTDEQLLESGWSILKKGTSAPVTLEAVVDPAANGSSPFFEEETETADDLVLGIPLDVIESGDSHKYLTYACRATAVGTDPWYVPPPITELEMLERVRKVNTPFMQLLERKRVGLAAATAAC